MNTKTKKTPLMTAETFGLTYSSSSLVHKSKFLRPDGSKQPKVERLHSLEAQHGFVPKLTRHSGKTVKTERRSHDCFCGFSFLLLKAAGCFQFVRLRRQASSHIACLSGAQASKLGGLAFEDA